jgi:hypothetical protein
VTHSPNAEEPTATAPTVAEQVLWTLTRAGATAQARRRNVAGGFQLEMSIWTGPRVDGQEDLCWLQRFTAESALDDTALGKKRQLIAAGWLEDIDATAGRP